ncbi:GMC family oxidoreductase [Streptomyces sp. NPDC057062]|uniref:GMC family oxidoreductase n=1 Tax=Streptomyces sp. NPDC057062 TaxID=3346011 RepID=UPI0036432F7D
MDEYDYIVVGGGTAGSVLAARLSENSDATVLLLEAGSATMPDLAAVPPAWPLLMHTDVDWADSTEVQEASGTPIHLPLGKGLGGSSGTNGLFFVRGHRSSYDAWVEKGAKGWGFDDLLPYFRRSERIDNGDHALHGARGPLSPERPDPLHPLIAAMLAGAGEIGFPLAADIGGGTETGFGPTNLSIADGKRQSAADAYLTPALHRPNLTVTTDASVSRITVSSGRATGVEYRLRGEAHRAVSRAEVVLTAGTIGSAQLLLLSGIGPKQHLSDVGIETVLDVPGVGANLRDHALSQVAYTPAREVPPTEHNHSGAIGLLRSPGSEIPDLQLVFSDIALYGPAVSGPPGYAILVSAMLPRSRGTVLLRSADPTDRPRIDPKYYADAEDVRVVEAGLRIARDIGRADAMASWRGTEVAPGPLVDSAEDLRDYARRSLVSYMHPVGTCRIGGDDQAVVDSDLRVREVTGLRVADASVMPSLPSANPAATVYAIAEKAADMITRDGRR